MEIFGVFVHWKRATAESTGYPATQDILLVNEQSPQELQDWKAVFQMLADKVNKSDAYLFYNRLDMENGDVVTMTYYTSKESFEAFLAANQSDFDNAHVKRAALAELLQLEVTEKQAVFSMDRFDYDNADSVMEFFNSLP